MKKILTLLALGAIFTLNSADILKAEEQNANNPQAYYLGRGGPAGGGIGAGGGMGHGEGREPAMLAPGLQPDEARVGPGGEEMRENVPGGTVRAPGLEKPLPGKGHAYGRGHGKGGLHRGEEKREPPTEELEREEENEEIRR